MDRIPVKKKALSQEGEKEQEKERGWLQNEICENRTFAVMVAKEPRRRG
jgi:hypothetical protein